MLESNSSFNKAELTEKEKRTILEKLLEGSKIELYKLEICLESYKRSLKVFERNRKETQNALNQINEKIEKEKKVKIIIGICLEKLKELEEAEPKKKKEEKKK